jgi:hypothetical protein
MRVNLNVSNFFHYFILHPKSKMLDERDQFKAKVSSIALGVLTLGICHLVCAIAFRNYKVLPPGGKVSQLYTRAHSRPSHSKKTLPLPEPKVTSGPPKKPLPTPGGVQKTSASAPVSATSQTMNFSELQKVVSSLRGNGGATAQKKADLFELGMTRFLGKNISKPLQSFRLDAQEEARFSHAAKGTKSFLSEVFANNPLNMTTTSAFYDYESTSGADHYWVDFANAYLGGGCFTDGFVQEEIMVAEMPDFANHIAAHQNPAHPGWCEITTRTHTGPGQVSWVLQADPHPYLLKNVHRVQAIQGVYGREIASKSRDEIREAAAEISPPKSANVLAIAAPHLKDKNHVTQFDKSTLQDIFSNLMAGMSLVNKNGTKPIVLHSGQLGCGAFNNNATAVYVLHCLAAQHLGIEVKLHGYSQDKVREGQEAWERISPQLQGKTLDECLQIISNNFIYG